MTTIHDVIGDFTPLSNNVIRQLKLIRGAIACKIFYTSNLKDRVCRMGLTRLSQELGLDSSTISKNIQWLIDNGFLERIQDHTATTPAHYRCTEQFYQIAKGIDLIKSTIDDVNTPIDDVNTPIDLINQEEELKEELKEKDYLDSISEFKTGNESKAEPSDFEKHFGYRDEFLKIYNQQTGDVINVPAKKQTIVELAVEDKANPETWERAIVETVGNWSGHSTIPPLNRIIEVYRQGGDYERWKNKTYGENGNGSEKVVIK